MNCYLNGCRGDLEEREIVEVYKEHDGSLVVVDHIPAKVCSLCGYSSVSAEDWRRVESLLSNKTKTQNTAPVLDLRTVPVVEAAPAFAKSGA